MSHLLAIDLGTGSCRAILFDEDGAQLASSQREWQHAAVPAIPGSRVFDTRRNWRLICDCIRGTISAAGITAADIAAVSSTSMREGMVLYDASGGEIWACPNVDSRASAQAEVLVQSGRAREMFERGGDWVAITSPARFLWIRENQPDVFRDIAHVGMLSDWVLTRLTGRFVTDPSSGSSSNLFDLSRRTWSPETLALIGLSPEVVPEVLESGSVVGPVTRHAASETGLAEGTPVVVGGADTQLGLIGIGVVHPGQVTLVGGSFWQLTVVTGAPLIDPQARVRSLCHAVPGQWMTEGIGFYSGLVMRWFRDAFCEAEKAEATRQGVDPYAVMERVASAVPAGANGLLAIFSNLMDVKRWVQATPSFVGFDVEDPARTDRRACIRAIEEQAAYVSRGHLRIIEELTQQSYSEIIFTGGGANGQLWPQVVADVLGVAVRVPAVKESTALGAALYAGVGAGLYRDISEAVGGIVRFERVVDPDPDSQAVYDRTFERWKEVYPRILQLSEEGLSGPMWWPAGASKPPARL